MIPVRRFDEPEVLCKNAQKWLAAFLQERAFNPGKRPSSSQYAHKQVVSALEAMSHHKCFYCEQSTKQTRREVDHHVEVASRPDLAFTWANLYLSCCDCNGKKQPDSSVPVSDCVDPCDVKGSPSEHLTFDDEQICARHDSARGRCTIQKYGLGRADLDYKRGRQLRLMVETTNAIYKKMIDEGRKAMNEDELELLRRFAQPERPFSLMCSVHLERHGFLPPPVHPAKPSV